MSKGEVHMLVVQRLETPLNKSFSFCKMIWRKHSQPFVRRASNNSSNSGSSSCLNAKSTLTSLRSPMFQLNPLTIPMRLKVTATIFLMSSELYKMNDNIEHTVIVGYKSHFFLCGFSCKWVLCILLVECLLGLFSWPYESEHWRLLLLEWLGRSVEELQNSREI